MINYLKFRMAMWLLQTIPKKNEDMKERWNGLISMLEYLFPHHNCEEFCTFCSGPCKRTSVIYDEDLEL